MLKNWTTLWIGVVIGVALAPNAFGQGALLSAGGPVHRSMGGASTAAPLSAIGAIYWNPATIDDFRCSELEVGSDFLFINHRVQSTFAAISGSTEADPGVFPIPNFGWVHKVKNSDCTIGLGMNSVAGFKTTLPADATNPILFAQPNGLGAVSSEATFMQAAPVLCLAMTDQLSIAAGPTLTLGQIGVSPFVFDAANGDGTYPAGHGSRYHFGGGVQAGFFYRADNGWNIGGSIKSPSWMEEFEFLGQDENGAPRTMTADVDLPMILSIGVATGSYRDWLFAIDARYIDYDNTDGFGDPAVFQAAPARNLQGLGWRSVFATAVGIQRRLNDCVVMRMGYSYNQSPIEDQQSFYNTPAPLLYEHVLSVGGSYELCKNVVFSAAYSHYFENDRQGLLVSPTFGPLAGTSVTNTVSANLFSFGFQMRH